MKIELRYLCLASLVAFQCNSTFASDKVAEMNSVRTYMALSPEIDPAHIISMADLEISIALASPLVSFDQQRQVTASLAEKWEILPPRKIHFIIKKNLKWSDGSEITALDFKTSLDRAKKTYPTDLKALFESIENIKAIDKITLEIETKMDVEKSGILLKLTEPMYSLLSINNGTVNLTKSSGPYYIQSKTGHELTLKANTHWFKFRNDMPQTVVIRTPVPGADQVQQFQNDDWVNLISGSSLMKASTKKDLEASGVKFWERSLDKVFSLYPSKRFLKSGGASTIKYISSHLDFGDLTSTLSGLTKAEQFFPRGYELWSTAGPHLKLQGTFSHNQKLKIIIPETGYVIAIKEALQKALNRIPGISVELESVKLPDLNERMKKGDYDLLGTGLAVADPNFEGAMSFFFERSPAFISSTEAPFDFDDQVRKARELTTSKERASAMRSIVINAQEAGYVLPLFHFSSMAMAKNGVDLSQIPNSDETVLFWKVRIK